MIVLVGLVAPGRVQAQSVPEGAYGVTYRPDNVNYRVRKSDHFSIIYQEGALDMARRTARALERTKPGTDSLVGTVDEQMQMPVVINDFNDRSNGFVQAYPFRQEIEAPSLRSDALVARASSWPALVAPHEQVHAAHAEVDGTVGVGSLLRLFAPDMARGINLLAPRGLVEGVAVYRESRLEPGAGRLNAPLFTMKMKAAMLSDDPWSLTQMLEAPAYTQPFNRFYIGGAHAFEYLAERGDSTSTEFFRTTVRWHNRLPLIGHGVWVGAGTEQWPASLGSEIQSTLRARYRAEMERRAPFTSTTLVAGEKGRNYRRPYWLDDETLVAYVHGYDVRRGFYRIDASTGNRERVRVQTITEDYAYSLSRDTSALYAGRYVQDPLVPRRAGMEVERVSLNDGRSTRLTNGGRAGAPAQGPTGRVYAVANDGPFTRLTAVTDSGKTRPLTSDNARSIRQVAPSPRDSTVAVLVNEDGRQYLARTTAPIEQPATLTPWLALQDAVIYDVSWGPEGRYLLFAADWGGTANVFAYDTENDRVHKMTNVRYGALEPALSPDRSTLAFVKYRHERHDLVRRPFRPDAAPVVPDSVVRRGPVQDDAPSATRKETEASSTVELGAARPYAAWRHLAPRMVYPTLHGEGDDKPLPYLESPDPSGPLGVGVGLGMQGVDPLQRWAYQGTAFWQDGRLWGEVEVESGAVLLRPSLAAYNRPFSALIREGGDRRAVAVEERGGGIGLRLPISLESNVYQSRLQVELDAEVRQTRLYGGAVTEPTSYTTRATLEPRVTYAHRLQQSPRDLVPNTGVVLGLQGEADVWTDGPDASRGLVASADTYLPVLRDTHTGIRLGARALVQNQGSVFSVGTFVPRGHSSVDRLPSGPFLQFEAEVTQPLWYIDDGSTLLPLYAEVLALYGFGETLGSVEGWGWQRARSSVGGGVSLRIRLFSRFRLDLRVGAAYRPEATDVTTVYR
ncbi:MAG: hypothetical protein BRD55_11410 [Bacteroidetes bacterium SW_9_63_38]|nr:MAG: hypothetical protein BRD55_11410 [Bacteroidetes bacterium SW_9_63_38]